MATNTNLKVSESNIICGLGTYTHVTTNTGMYFASAQSQIVPPSSLSITIAQSGSASASVTNTAPSATETQTSIQTVFNIVAGDVITITLSSSVSNDNQLNTGVSTIVTIHQGSS